MEILAHNSSFKVSAKQNTPSSAATETAALRARALTPCAADSEGSIDDTAKLSAGLAQLFRDRELNHVYNHEMLTRLDLPEASRIERTVFIRGPRSVPYGDVIKVIDGIKGAGANPIGLQIDNLN